MYALPAGQSSSFNCVPNLLISLSSEITSSEVALGLFSLINLIVSFKVFSYSES